MQWPHRCHPRWTPPHESDARYGTADIRNGMSPAPVPHKALEEANVAALGPARFLVIMGSGETSPTMARIHREVLAAMGPAPVPAVLIDTPFGFQTNCSQISSRAVKYFHESVGVDIGISHLEYVDQLDPAKLDRAHSAIISARYVFAGPGSPTYALRNWTRTLVPKLLAEKLVSGGAVVFSSAAALTLGVATVPVYEIYKVGEDPHWVEGLDLLNLAGLRAAVIPHFDNAEGGTHDTRYCYLGEERLRLMEAQLPEGAFVLGVDEHTACLMDLREGSVRVAGLGGLTIRAGGSEVVIAADAFTTISEIADIASDLTHRRSPHRLGLGEKESGLTGGPLSGVSTADGPGGPDEQLIPGHSARVRGGEAFPARPKVSPLLAMVYEHEEGFRRAIDARNLDEALRTVLEFEEHLEAWSADTTQSDERDRARASLRHMIQSLAMLAIYSLEDPHAVLAPVVEAVLRLREVARLQSRWKEADATREILVSLGMRVHDAATGTTWDMPGIETWNDLISLWHSRVNNIRAVGT